jgi:Phage related hypothetical protein (DUF1799)
LLRRPTKKLEALAKELYSSNTLNEGELAKFGLTAADFELDEIVIWPENYESYSVFMCMGTQWRTGMAGATGLDYSALNEVWNRLDVPLSRRDDVFQDIRVMENEALKTMRANKG